MSTHVSLYNPRATPPEQLEAMLVGREPLLKELLTNLQEQARGQTRQHWLIRGPRGMGKTHLTGIIHHRVRNDPKLSGAYLPLWLGEADVYEVYSPATLLERIAERLIEVVPDSKLSEKLHQLSGTGDEEGFFQEISAHLADEAARLGKILLVLMENLDALLEGFAPKERKAQLRQLRSLLLHDPHFLFISTTPTKYMPALTNPKEPLYNQFKERSLKPLTVEEVGSVFAKLAEMTERKGMEGLLGDSSEAALRRKVIHQLTGGLPRSVVMAFEVMRDKSGIQPLVEDLRALLDAQTAYFEARLSKLAPRERAIVTVMALAPKNLTLKEIAEKSRLPERSLSTLMSRLLQDGHVEVTYGSGGKGTVYGLSEGLFRLWYQYRKGRLLLEPLVNLLAYLYSATELRDTVTLLKGHMVQHKRDARYSAQLALLQVEEALRFATSEEGQRERERLWKECQENVEGTHSIEAGKKLLAAIEELLGNPSPDVVIEESAYEALARHVLDVAPSLPTPIALECVESLLRYTYLLGQTQPEASFGFLKMMMQLLALGHYPAARQSMITAHLYLAIRVGERGGSQEALENFEAVLNSEGDYSPHSDPEFTTAALLGKAEALELLGRKQEAIGFYEKFIDKAQRQGSFNNLELTIVAFNALARIHGASGNFRKWEAALLEVERLVRTSAEKSHRDIRGRVLLQLILVKGAIPTEETIKEVTDWIREFPEHSMVDEAQKYQQAIETLMREVETPEQAPKFVVGKILSNPAELYSLIGARGMKIWLAVAEQRGLDAKQADAIRLHMLVADALEAASFDKPDANARLKQVLGQIPPELHQMVEELIEVERQWRKNPPPEVGKKSKRP